MRLRISVLNITSNYQVSKWNKKMKKDRAKKNIIFG